MKKKKSESERFFFSFFSPSRPSTIEGSLSTFAPMSSLDLSDERHHAARGRDDRGCSSTLFSALEWTGCCGRR
jgi:hypothetical protein